MRPLLPLAALSLAAALAPAPAAADAWALRAGAGYAQANTWTTAGESTRIPRLDLDLGLNAGGSLGGPGLLDWSGVAQVQRTAVNGNDDVQRRLAYGLRATLFGDPSGPLSLSASAVRRDEQFSTDGASAGSIVGNTYGGEVVLRATGARPWLNGAYGWTRDAADTLALGRTRRSLQTVSASSGLGASTFSYSAAYRGSFSDGTFETDRYADHQIDATVDAGVGADTRLRLQNRYFVRDTATMSAINARQEESSVAATVLITPTERLQQSGGYAYGRATQRTSVSALERVSHHVSYGIGGPLPAPGWTLHGSAVGTFDEIRQDTAASRSTSQAVSGLLAWRRALSAGSLELHGGPTVGALEPQGGRARMGYAVTSGIAHQLTASVRTSVGYDVAYADDVGSDQGWTLRHAANGSASARVGLSSLTAMLQATADRRQSPVLGRAESRQLNLIATWRLRTSDLSLQVGYQDGTIGQLPGGTAAGGLYVAPAFSSHSATAVLAASTTLGRMLTSGRVRYSSNDLPDRASYDETQLHGAVDYAYGALRIGVEDTYVVTRLSAGRVRVNQLLVRAYRVFGSRF